MKIFGNRQGQWAQLGRSWGTKIGIIGITVMWLTLIAVSWADAAENSDEYSFTWLDPEKKISVLQNRRYAKANRLLLSALVGPGFSNPYRNSYTAEPRVGFYVSEAFGIEAFYGVTTNKSNATFEALKQSQPNVWPLVREIKSSFGLLAHWAPWYAKINVFNKILYFDWYFSAGAGTVQTALETRKVVNAASTFTDQNFTAFYLGTGHQYHLNNDLTVRLDFTSAIYRAPIGGLTGDMDWFSNMNFGLGLGIRI